MLEVTRGNGTYVSKRISLSPIFPILLGLLLQKGSPTEAFELRVLIEIGTLEIGIDKFTREDYEKMKKTIDKLKAAYEEGVTDTKLLVKHDLDFHYAFAESTRNSLIIELTRSFWEVFSFSIEQFMKSRKDVLGAIENHTAMLEVLEKKEINKARKVIKKTIKDWEMYSLRAKKQ